MTLGLTNTTQTSESGASQLSLSTTKNEDLRFIYPSPESGFRISTGIVPVGSKWHAGLHWHEEYDEVMRVTKGRAKIILGNGFRIVGPEDGEVIIKKGVVHDVMRADVDHGEELWLEERSDPVDGSKELFFRHVFSVMGDKKLFGWKMPLQVLLTMMYTDGYLVIVPGPARWYVTHALWATVKVVALGLGLKPFYDEYTPERLRGVAEKLSNGEKLKTA